MFSVFFFNWKNIKIFKELKRNMKNNLVDWFIEEGAQNLHF